MSQTKAIHPSAVNTGQIRLPSSIGMKKSYLKRQVGFAVLYTVISLLVFSIDTADRWSYYGFISVENLFNYSLILTLVALAATFIPLRRDARSSLLTTLLYVFYIPSLIIAIPSADGEHLKLLIVSFILIISLSSLNISPIRGHPISPQTFLGACILVSACLVLALLSLGFGRNFNLDYSAVYEFREETTANMPAVLAYAYSGISKVIFPAAAVLAVWARKWLLLSLVVAMALVTFGLTSHKSVIFITIGVAIAFIIQRRSYFNTPLIIAFICFMFIASIDAIIFKEYGEGGLISGLIVRRIFFLPPLIDQFYVDFFSNNTNFFWSSSTITLGFLDQPYDVTAPFLIGEIYFGQSNTSANTGLIGSGAAQAGLLGVSLYAAAFGIIISLLNGLGRLIGPAAVASISLPVVVTIVNTSDFITVLLTHGLAMLIIFLSFCPVIYRNGTEKR